MYKLAIRIKKNNRRELLKATADLLGHITFRSCFPFTVRFERGPVGECSGKTPIESGESIPPEELDQITATVDD